MRPARDGPRAPLASGDLRILYSMDVARLKSPSHHGRYDEYRPLSSMVSVEGLGQWRERRNEWMEAHPAQEPDPERLMELRNLESRLRKSLPDRLTHDEITAKLGSSWIPAGVIRDFMIDTFKIRQRPDITEGGLRSLSVSHDETTGNWQVKSSLSPKLDETTIQEYGLGTGPGRNPFEIVAGALNSTTSNLTKPDPNDPTGKRKVRDPQATAMLYQKRHAVEQAFTEWVWNDPDRTRMLENVYNQRFNRIRPREYDGSYLTFPGISSDIDLYGHQRKAVARILQSEEGTLIAHVVGAGKTFTGVAACHEAKRLGKATKPMIVVPNHLTEQWAKDFLTLYPDANILSMTEADGAGKGAARFWAKVAGGDWDAVIVRQDTFQRMHVSPERRQRYFDRRKSEMLKSIETAKTDGNDFAAKKLKDEIGKMEKNLSKTVKQNEKDRARVDGKLQALRGGENNKDWIDFEDLGVDMLFVDEAHQYKNLAIATTISVPGVDVAAAQKCEDLFDKCEYLRDQGRGRTSCSRPARPCPIPWPNCTTCNAI
ncbi:MAG: DEAD/DEAH box helicase family protein [Bifidobacterium adolescentis]